MPVPEDIAVELSDEFKKKQQELIQERAAAAM
jgi:hypothetical protein